MEALVTRILELSSSTEADSAPDDVVDLGASPDTTTDNGRFTPNPNTYTKTETNGSYTDTTGYSKVSNMRGFVGSTTGNEERRQSSACFCS
jgi:hypothetical protein